MWGSWEEIMKKNKYTVQTFENNENRAFSVYIETKTYEEKTVKEKVQHIFEYLSKHVGLLIFCLSVASIFVKAYVYLYECGKLSYLNISSIYVNSFNENTIYSFLGNAFLAIILCAMNAMIYCAIASEKKFSTKIKEISRLYFITWIGFFLIFVSVDWPIGQSLKYSLYLVILLYLAGSALGIARVIDRMMNRGKAKAKHKSELSNDSSVSTSRSFLTIVSIVVILLSLYGGVFYAFGYWDMSTEKEYRMIGKDLVVLHEGVDLFLVSPCKIIESGPKKELKNLLVYEAIQTEIKKTDITTTLKRFDHVKKEGYPSVEEDAMQFSYNNFTCDIDVFYHEDDVMVRFYDRAKEQSEEEITDLVLVDSGYGFLCLKYKGDGGLLSGYLDKKFFSSEEMVDAAISLLEKISPQAQNIYLPYHIDLVELTNYVEYNGEY